MTITNYKTQCIISITPTCFGTRVPSAGSLRKQKFTSAKHYFRIPEIEFWTSEFCVRKLPADGTLVPKYVGGDTYHGLCFMICNLL